MLIYLTILLYVCTVSALSSFIEEGKRAKLFELTDNTVSVFKVTLPDEEYKALIDECQTPNDFMDIDFEAILKQENLDNFKLESNNGFKSKNATLSVEINGEKQSFNKVTLSLGGISSRTFGRQAFNLKIRGNKDLYGRSQFRLRSDAREATTLRSKLACDIHNRLGLVSISANYISLYINDNYIGLFVLMDAPKVSWAKLVYDDENTRNLYKCKSALSDLTVKRCANRCDNENDDIKDNSEWVEFLTALDNAQSAEDIEDIFDIDQFLYEIAYEYLSGSWDHYLYNGHNFNVYKVKDGKCTIIYYDFDGDFGQDDSSRFETILKKVVVEAFNPTVLFPRIDKLKNLIRSEKIKEKTPDENGDLPGFINKFSTFDYSLEQWDANCEFTTVSDDGMSTGYGIKYWILMRYRYVCKAYNIECDPTYMDENYKFTINKKVETQFAKKGHTSNKPQNPTITTTIEEENIPTVSPPTPSTTVTITTTLTIATTNFNATPTSIEENTNSETEIEVDDVSGLNIADDESDSDSDNDK
ncbi:hypothetical protein PIROE2DRAFT_6588 [Piromyces sp. E2]|nr:hypothetical protein PIROE2DRAFT_6588 [Piromyces sp. E2]|eukprot:OUM66247.1 hypothetical protein PIROE2DRAFT_6588 [Piromyces sp. E2]